jgi:hypothetical protein
MLAVKLKIQHSRERGLESLLTGGGKQNEVLLNPGGVLIGKTFYSICTGMGLTLQMRSAYSLIERSDEK